MQAAASFIQNLIGSFEQLHINLVVNNTGSGARGSINLAPAADSPRSFSSALSDPPDSLASLSVGVASARSEGSTASELEWWQRAAPAGASQDLVDRSAQLASFGHWTGLDRINTVFHRGVQAARIIRGGQRYFFGERVPCRNHFYVVLRSDIDIYTEPFYTESYHTYCAAVKTGPRNSFSRNSVSHGFGDLLEVSAFCEGAGLHTLPRFLH